jgi:hypothetical protein
MKLSVVNLNRLWAKHDFEFSKQFTNRELCRELAEKANRYRRALEEQGTKLSWSKEGYFVDANS